MNILRKGDMGRAVRALQRQLTERGYIVDATGTFDTNTERAVKAFQAQNLDQHGQPLVVDGSAGPLTLWSLQNPKPLIQTPSAVDYSVLPSPTGKRRVDSKLGRAALTVAIEELNQGAGEVGGNNRGPFVRKYLEPAGLDEGNAWCAAFVSWCFYKASGEDRDVMPFQYTAMARDLRMQFKRKGWAHEPNSDYIPVPGDIVVWWRVSLQGWQGHAGLVHSVKDGILYTIEGNKSTKVQGFSYVLSRVDKLLGYGHVP